MKRRRGNVKSKTTKSAPFISDKAASNGTFLNTNDRTGVVDHVPDNIESRRESAAPRTDSNTSGWPEDPNSLRQMVKFIIQDLAKGMIAEPSRGFSSNHSPINSSSPQRPQSNGLPKDNTRIDHENPQYKKEELKAALSVIKRVMKLSASKPFNVPVDPIALGIPDYFDVIDTPMDFGTIRNDLENGTKYMNSEDVYKDVELIWDNCSKYNSKDNQILELMNLVKRNFMKNWTAAGLYRDPDPEQPIGESSTMKRGKQGKAKTVAPVPESPATPVPESPATPVSESPAAPIHVQQEAGFTQVVNNQPSPIGIVVDEPGTNSSQHQSSQQQQSSPEQETATIQRKLHGRGPTRCIALLNTNERIVVATNELGQPIGPEAAKLTSFLGLTARDGKLAPLTYPSWKSMPEENKEAMWQKVLSKFDIDPDCRRWVLTSLGLKWGNFRFHLKADHYDVHETDAERLADRDKRVEPDQWSFLVNLWSSEQWKRRSAINKANRAKMKYSHTSGKKSFARIREEERAKRSDGKEPSRAELFIVTRTRKNGEPVNEATAAIISQLRESAAPQENSDNNGSIPCDEVYTRVMGPERKGGVRLYGLGGPRSRVTHGNLKAMKMASEACSEVREIKEKVVSLEQTCAQMASQMASMMSMMADIQKNPPCQHALDVLPEPVSPSHHGSSLRQTRGRKRKL